MVDEHRGNGCSSKRVSYYNEISGGHIGRAVVRRRYSAGSGLPLWVVVIAASAAVLVVVVIKIIEGN